MDERTFTKHEARQAFGQRFVEIMMRDKREIKLSAKQMVAAKRWKLLSEGHFRPFAYDYVYIVSDGEGAAKVGYSQKIRHRINSLQTSSPKALHLDHAFVLRRNGGRNVERAIHRALKADDRHIRGEWFKCEGLVETAREIIDSNYPTVALTLDAAWEGAEQLMEITRAMLKTEPGDLERVEDDRRQFLWLATILRAKEGDPEELLMG